MLGDEAPGRLVSPDAAEMRGHPHRSADVGAVVAGHHAARYGRRAPARRAAGGTVRVVGVGGAAIDRVEALPVGEVDRDVGLADDHRAGRLQPLDEKRVGRGDLVLEARVPPGGGEPGDIEALLDRHRHAEQRLVRARTGGVERLGLLVGALEIGDCERVDCGVEVLDPLDRRIDRLDDAHPPRADRGSGRERAGLAGQLRIGHVNSLPLAARSRHARGGGSNHMWIGLPVTAIAASLKASAWVGWAWQV